MGLTVLDAGVVIALLDASDAHHAAAVASVGNARDRGDPLLLPASAYAECLVSPHRRGPDAVRVVDRFLDALPARVEPADRSIASAAAAQRATHGISLRLPDALVIATAIVRGVPRLGEGHRAVPPGQRVLFDRIEIPREFDASRPAVLAAILLDLKRIYMELRPSLRRIFTVDREALEPGSTWKRSRRIRSSTSLSDNSFSMADGST